jgi:hypothetical protein
MDDDLLVIGLQIAGRLGFIAERLDGVQDIFLLVDHGVTQFLGPFEVLVHQIDDFRIVEQPEHAGIPVFIGLEG